MSKTVRGQVSILNCDFFIPKKDILERSSERHDEIVDFVKKIYEQQGEKCVKEYSISDQDLKGSIDLLCYNEDKYEIIEVKSTRISRGRIQDIIQLSMYAYLFNKNRKNVDKLLELSLVYRDERDNKIVILKIPNDLKDHIIELGKKLAESSKQRLGGKLYVVGDLCNICENSNCPFKSSRSM
jgi:predicted RecB family nuclease